jgi:hypothetical protein
MLRRAVTALAAAAFAILAAGCSGVPGLSGGDSSSEAEALLARADSALAQVESMSFTMKMKGDVDGQEFVLTMRGGGYLRGEQIGDMAFDMTIESAGVQAGNVRMVMRDGSMHLNTGGGWRQLPGVELSAQQLEELNGRWGPLDVARYVQDVRVEGDTTFLGEPVTKIVGRVNAKDFLKAMFGQLGDSLGSLGMTEVPDDVLEGFGDIRFVIYVSRTTHLVRAVHEAMTFEQDGHELTLSADVVVDRINEPVEIPELALAAV